MYIHGISYKRQFVKFCIQMIRFIVNQRNTDLAAFDIHCGDYQYVW